MRLFLAGRGSWSTSELVAIWRWLRRGLQSRFGIHSSEHMTRMTSVIFPNGQPGNRYACFGFLLFRFFGGVLQPLGHLLQLFSGCQLGCVVGSQHMSHRDQCDTSDGESFDHAIEDESLVTEIHLAHHCEDEEMSIAAAIWFQRSTCQWSYSLS